MMPKKSTFFIAWAKRSSWLSTTPSRLLAGEAVKLAAFELNFLLGILVLEELLHLGAQYEQRAIASRHRLEPAIHPPVERLFIDA